MKTKRTLKHFAEHYEQSREGQKHLAKLKLERDALAGGAALAARQNAQPRIKITDNAVMRFALCGDMHIGSRYEMLPQLRAFMEFAEREGCETILCTGDVLDGWKMYPGQEYELHKMGWNDQRDWFADQAPKPGIPVQFITGNHDASFKKLAGVVAGVELEKLVPGWRFLGEDFADVLFEANGQAYRVTLIHPDGGTSYALSYRGQKITEQIEGGNKPNLLGIGHFHKAELIPSYRNVCVLQTGTFQRQTPYMQRRGLSAHMGGWVIEVGIGDNTGGNRIKSQFVAFY